MTLKRILLSLSLVVLATPALAHPPRASRATRRAQVTRLAQNQPRPTARPAVTPTPAPARPATTPATPATPTPTAQPAQPAQNARPTADQIAQRIQDFYDRTTDFQADFRQTSRNRLYNREERRSGHVYFRRPGKMRWNYAQPSGDVIVTDGSTLWAYDSQNRQAIQQNLAQSQLPTAITFLAGQGRLADSFTFRLLDNAQFRYPQGHVLELRPRQPSPSYERIVFFVSDTFQVVRTVVIDAQGNQNRFDFERPQVNMSVPENLFRWSPPAGTSIVRP